MCSLVFKDKNLIRIANFLSLVLREKSATSSNIWLERQKKDPYVKRAIKETYRARSAFKLIEINEKVNFLHPGDIVIDIGACPGSWSQVAVKKTNSTGIDKSKPQGLVVSIDREFIEKIEGAHTFSFSDINDKQTFEKVKTVLNGRQATSVISDMAPNCSGNSTLDHDSIIKLQMCAFEMTKKVLMPKGSFLCKIWFGDGTGTFQKTLQNYFEKVRIIKPPASRSDSAEIFLFCSNFNKN